MTDVVGIVTCSQCGQRNRVHDGHAPKHVRCGACKSNLSADMMMANLKKFCPEDPVEFFRKRGIDLHKELETFGGRARDGKPSV